MDAQLALKLFVLADGVCLFLVDRESRPPSAGSQGKTFWNVERLNGLLIASWSESAPIVFFKGHLNPLKDVDGQCFHVEVPEERHPMLREHRQSQASCLCAKNSHSATPQEFTVAEDQHAHGGAKVLHGSPSSQQRVGIRPSSTMVHWGSWCAKASLALIHMHLWKHI